MSRPPIKIDHAPSGGWFQHQSPKNLKVLRPLSYDMLEKTRKEELSIDPDYVSDRKKTEQIYHDLLGTSDEISFLYASYKGMMFDKDEYMGFTYYFHLTDDEIEKCVFDVVDKKKWMDPTVGHDGMVKSAAIWFAHHTEMESYYDVIGLIFPRIEIIIPFSVTPSYYYPQQEDR